MTNQKRILYVLQQPPYLNDRVFEAFDALLVAAAFEQDVSLLFRGAGIQQLLRDQQPTAQRSLAKMLGSLGAYDVDKVFAAEQDLSSGGLTAADLAITPTALDASGIQTLVAAQDIVLHD